MVHSYHGILSIHMKLIRAVTGSLGEFPQDFTE